jgi:hypothetical protein
LAKEVFVANLRRFVALAFFAICLLAGCRVSAPEKGSDAITLMANYVQRERYDDAISVAQDWMSKHPNDQSHAAIFYEQIATTYLIKASKDRARRDEWVKLAVAYFDKVLSVHQENAVDIELYNVGRGLESAGDLSSSDRCLYYGRAVKAFKTEFPFIQGDSYTAYGRTIPLEPVRQESQKALGNVKAKFEKAGCKREAIANGRPFSRSTPDNSDHWKLPTISCRL